MNATALEDADIDRLREIFVTRQECSENVTAENEKITELRVIQVKNSTKLSVLIGILSAISVPVISLCIKVLFGG